jgi:N-acetylglucosaminyl-diphospho-decaprenol L-rhamnosyltransferase
LAIVTEAPRSIVAIVLAYGGVDDARPLVELLAGMAILGPGQVILVHNPSRPGERAELDLPGVVIINNDRNVGYAAGMNVGLRRAYAAGADAILTLTHEARIDEAGIAALAAALAGDGELAAVGPVLHTPEGELSSAGMVPGRGVRLSHRRDREPAPGVLAPCESLDGSAILWRAAHVEALEGFDARFFMYYEEIDLCARARARGWEVAVLGGVVATSVSGGTNRRVAHAYLTTRNGLAYARRRGWRFFLRWWCSTVWWFWIVTPKPGGGRFRIPEERLRGRDARRGARRGVLDYLRGRWGPPPPELLSDSDIAAAH